MKNFIKNNWLSFAIILAAVIWGMLQLSSLPEQIPTHFDLSGTADKFSSKYNAIYTLPLVSFLLVFFINGMMKISPKQYSAEQSESAVAKLMTAITLFLMMIYFAMIKEANEPQQWMFRMLPLGFSLLIVFMGNYFSKIQKNFVTGLRLPWTLASDENWKRTHRFAGKSYVVAGVISFITSLIYPAFWISLTAMAIATVSAIVYSYVYYTKHENRESVPSK